MRKSLISAAIMITLVGGAFAQTTVLPGVTVYGNIDLGVRIDSGATGTGNASSAVRFDDGQWTTSRFGIKAERDLSNGLVANVELQGTVVTDGTGTGTANSYSFDRLSVVGLKSETWGYIDIGNEYTPMHRHVIKYNAANYDGYAGANNSSGLIRIATRRANQINYRSPNLNGFKVDIQLAKGESSIASNAIKVGDARALGLSYDNGPFSIGAAIESQKSAVGTDDFSSKSMGASYDFGVAKLFYVYGTKKGGVAITAADYDLVLHTLGVKVPLGAGSIAASIGSIDSRGSANADASSWGINYQYPIAKGINLYAMVGSLTNKNGATRVLKGGSGASGLFTKENVNSGTGKHTLNSAGFGINLYF